MLYFECLVFLTFAISSITAYPILKCPVQSAPIAFCYICLTIFQF